MSDLGTREGTHPVRSTALLYTLVVLVAVLLSVFLPHKVWLILAVLLILISAFGIWVLPELLTGDNTKSRSSRSFVPRPDR